MEAHISHLDPLPRIDPPKTRYCDPEVLMWITSTGTAYDAEFIHFHDVSVYIVESLQPVSAASVRECSEHCYYKGDKCVAFEYHEDGKCLMHTIIEYNGTTVSDLYIRNVKRIETPTYCHTEEFAEEIISSLESFQSTAYTPFITWLIRENETAPWQWGNGDAVNYTNWAPGHPTNSGNCMAVTNGTWSTYECSGGPPVRVLCQRIAYSP
ncbi:hypothetical protein Tcan_06998 [Toxocara canis]|uniref:C-type lectin domain-containing protein n=1 Tax=Toxocara canis TaxID=6265 RepID=A0A0B2W5N5_TOXCA|nr:hypothetical protein Tcan_06998 [Toxocara canis]